MTTTLGELKVLNVTDGSRALARQWKLVLAATIIGGVGGFIAALVVQPVWESEVNIQVGTLYGRPIEDASLLASFLSSEAFERSLPAELTRGGIRTHAVEVGPGGNAAYVRVIARGSSADGVHTALTHALKVVNERHGRLFATVTRNFTEYGDLLSRTVQQLDAGISRLEGAIERIGPTGGDRALAALVLQAQLQSTRLQQIQLSKQLSELRFDQAMNTRPTKEIAPPLLPAGPVWPRREFFVVLGAALGLVLSVLLVVLFAPRESAIA